MRPGVRIFVKEVRPSGGARVARFFHPGIHARGESGFDFGGSGIWRLCCQSGPGRSSCHKAPARAQTAISARSERALLWDQRRGARAIQPVFRSLGETTERSTDIAKLVPACVNPALAEHPTSKVCNCGFDERFRAATARECQSARWAYESR